MQTLLGSAGGNAADVVFDIPMPGLFDSKCFSLTKKQRLYGFLICFIAGCVASIFSTIFLTTFNYTAFGVVYTAGNITAIFSTAFIIGPMQQFKNMFHKKRVLATLLYLGTLIATLVVAFKTGSAVGVLVMVGIQCVALVWYTASYIPYARTLLVRVMKSCVSST